MFDPLSLCSTAAIEEIRDRYDLPAGLINRLFALETSFATLRKRRGIHDELRRLVFDFIDSKEEDASS